MRVEGLGEIEVRVIDKFSQFGNFPHFLKSEDLIFFVSVHSKTSGVVASVLES